MPAGTEDEGLDYLPSNLKIYRRISFGIDSVGEEEEFDWESMTSSIEECVVESKTLIFVGFQENKHKIFRWVGTVSFYGCC